MVLVPAHCDACGLDFQPRAISLGPGARNITLVGNLTNCPRCGGIARFIEGEFNVKDGKFEVLSASDVTREMLVRLQLLIDEAEAHPSRLDEIKQKAEAVHAGFGGLFNPLEWSPEVKAALIAAVAAAMVARCAGGGTTVINVAPKIIIEAPDKRTPQPPLREEAGGSPAPKRERSA